MQVLVLGASGRGICRAVAQLNEVDVKVIDCISKTQILCGHPSANIGKALFASELKQHSVKGASYLPPKGKRKHLYK